ncbi:hypothetical protein [Nocardioides jejuensis]|uniref:DUF559 domain-containing protein n=1 Tax=Nocardioides jejuensis TaxID=2502782 RepID=A0A4R1CB23_9ACTN|nr:hypothetical protein [Nocardioides jejuensis]TCJ28070.1 hypothetical protein EPD65_08780 [Nocardioides jejuensis]
MGSDKRLRPDRATPPGEWRAAAASQAGLLTRAQLSGLGYDERHVRHRLGSDRWQLITPIVVATFTGTLTRDQLMWAGVLHGGPRSAVGGIAALELHGIRNWTRPEISVVIPKSHKVERLDGVRYVETRRDFSGAHSPGFALPVLKVEPAALLFAAYERNRRTAEGLLAAVVQQRLATPASLREWIDLMQPLRRTHQFRQALDDFEGGSQSLGERDFVRICKRVGLPPPDRQTRRKDASGRWRYTDAEWHLPDGTVVMLEIDGGFHMEVEHWQDDMERARALARPGVIQFRCTTRELRDAPEILVQDLRRVGVGRSSV